MNGAAGRAGDPWRYRHYGRVLCRDPLIISGTTVLESLAIGLAPLLSPTIGDRPAYFLLRLFWQTETPAKIADLVAAHRRHAAAHPAHRVIILANSVREAWRLQQAGIRTILCNHNALVDEHAFDVLPAEEKRFDAVYNARLRPYKRHELACAIASLALIYDAPEPGDLACVAAVRRMLGHAVFVNHLEGVAAVGDLPRERARHVAIRVLGPDFAPPLPAGRVAQWLNRARVGLCLSRSEGAMYASMEYLLCGLPIVSTRSMGGRDHYFEPAHTRVVDDDPVAVAAAVAELSAARIDPQEIRATALAKVRHDRRLFVDLLQELIDESGGTMDVAARFPAMLKEGLFRLSSIAALAAEIAGAVPPGAVGARERANGHAD